MEPSHFFACGEVDGWATFEAQIWHPALVTWFSLPRLNSVGRTCWLHGDWPSSLSQLKVTCLIADCASAGTEGCGCETLPAEESSSFSCGICCEPSLLAEIKPFSSSLHECWQHCKSVPWASAVVVGVCGQQGRRRRRRRRQLVVLLGSISSAPSTAATNLSSALFCNGKSKADWALTAGRGWGSCRRESRQTLSSPTVRAFLLFIFIYNILCVDSALSRMFVLLIKVAVSIFPDLFFPIVASKNSKTGGHSISLVISLPVSRGCGDRQVLVVLPQLGV